MAELKKIPEKSNKKIITLKKKNTSSNKKVVTKGKPISLEKKLESSNKAKKKKKTGKILNFILSLMMFLGICIMGVVIAFCVYIVMTAPSFDTDKLYNKEATIFYAKDQVTEIGRVGDQQRELKTYEDLPEVLIDALVATEDSRFFQHNGFDVVRFVKASLGQAVGQYGAGGASTLTMQVAKNTFSKNEDGTIAKEGIEGIIRKFHDIYVSIFLIERNYTKEQIIEFYVNSNFLGNNTYGVEQASQKYFGKSVSNLSLTEAALLVGIFNAPSQYNPFFSIELATQRRATVLSLMQKHGYITEEQEADANAIKVESLLAEKRTASSNPYQAFIDTVAKEVEEKTGNDPYKVPMLVYTTMDPEKQIIMNDLNEGKLGYKFKTYAYNDWQDIIQIGVAVLDVNDGSLAAINIGRNVEGAGTQLWNRAIDTKTQPGSTAKPIFAYGPYLEYNNGNTGTIFYDIPYTYTNGSPLKNSDGKYQGALTMRQALARSRNIPAIQAFQAVDREKIGEFAHNLGIKYEYRRNQQPDYNIYESYAIGGGLEVSALDLAAAYATFARGGYYIEPYSYTKIIYRETDEVDDSNSKYEKKRAMSEETAYMINDMLMTATAQGVGGKIKVSGTDVGSKTGTSTYDAAALKARGVPLSASADNWVITYSPDYVISLWYGVDSLAPKVYTDTIAAAVERIKISAILSNKIFPENSRFKKPSSVVSTKYELETNPAELPSDYTPSDLISTELFKKGTEPSEVSERFQKLKDPTNGTSEVKGNTITLEWDGISTPSAISDSYLLKYFTDNFGQMAQTYYDRRINYNNSNVGSVGYQVYLETPTGLESLGFTQDTYYKYVAPSAGGKYKFVVKSAYSIFKANQSNGLKINVDLGGNIPELPDENDNKPGEDEEKNLFN